METLVLGPLPSLSFGNLQLPTYNILISLIFCVLVWYVNGRALKKNYSGTTALDLTITVLLAGAVGARLLHIIYEAPQYYLEDPWRVFYIWHGGFVFFGGVLGALLGAWIALKIKGQSFPMWADFAAPVVSLGYILGRFACFLTGCCYGRICDLPWAYGFRELNLMSQTVNVVHRHPTQLYAMLTEGLVLAAILYVEKKRWLATKAGTLFSLWLALHSVGRLIMEHFRDDDRGAQIGMFSISQLLSLIFLFLSIAYLIRRKALSKPS